MTQIQLAEWEWPENPRFLMCTPLSHAGAAFFAPVVIKGGSLYVMLEVRPGRGAGVHRGEQDPGDDAGAVDALRADGPPRLAHPRPEQPRDRLLRRQRDQPRAPQGGHRPVRADLRPVLRPVRGADGHHLPRQAGPRHRRRRAGCRRAAARRRSSGPRCSTRTATRSSRASRARSAWPARCCAAATGSCRTRPPRPSATAGCTPATWPARTRTASGTSSTAPRT